MGSVRDVRCAGIMLVRRLILKDSSPQNDNNNKGKGDKASARGRDNTLVKLEMVFLESYSGHFKFPRGRIGSDENEMVAAQRVTQHATRYSPKDYDVIQDFSFIMEDLNTDCKKTIFWIAVLNDGVKKPVNKSSDYKNQFWLDFELIKKLGQSGVGKLQNNLNQLLDNFNQSSEDIERIILNHGVDA